MYFEKHGENKVSQLDYVDKSFIDNLTRRWAIGPADAGMNTSGVALIQ